MRWPSASAGVLGSDLQRALFRLGERVDAIVVKATTNICAAARAPERRTLPGFRSAAHWRRRYSWRSDKAPCRGKAPVGVASARAKLPPRPADQPLDRRPRHRVGQGKPSPIPIIVCRSWSWQLLQVARGGAGKERIGARLIGAKCVAAALQHVRFERRNAGDVHQEPIHAGRPGKRDQTPGVAAAEIDREQRIGEPAEPFEEIIRMPRPAPQADVAIRSRLAGSARKRRNCASASPSPAMAANRTSTPRQSCRRKPGSGFHAASTIDSASGMLTSACFCTRKNICRDASAPHSRDQPGVARIVGDARGAPRDMQAEPERPERDQNRHQHLPRRHAPSRAMA